MKYLILILSLIIFINCSSDYNKEKIKIIKSQSASQRINNSDNNNSAIFDELR